MTCSHPGHLASHALYLRKQGATSILGPIFDDLFGTCSGVSGFKAMLTTCPTYKNATTCNAASGCSWSGFGSSGSCDIGEGAFGMDLLMDPNDSWVKQVNNATATCTSKTSSVACSGAGNVNVDTSVYTTTSYVSAAQPSYVSSGGGGAAGMAAVSSLVSLMAGGLFALFFLL